ncbi:hypothetical protein RND71_005349 [Anisodus tanguticus]|uniref:Uncharacterized protein n=1 Tax=Anisodus tanguticus TaxID=243964 RepID=A0AAE1SSS7_9SOLA|nr:hypothetical protein RND71_005349 [Anisodus tanguticus]
MADSIVFLREMKWENGLGSATSFSFLLTHHATKITFQRKRYVGSNVTTSNLTLTIVILHNAWAVVGFGIAALVAAVVTYRR